MKIDPVTLEVVRGNMIRIAEQMAVTIQRTAYSPIIYEGNDFVCAVCDKQGNMLSGTIGLPHFLGNISMAVRDIDATIGIRNLEPGDIVFCNDPYIGGGTHGNDVLALLPIHYGDSILGYVGFKGHTMDVGGASPSGFNCDTTEIFQEMLRIPPVKLYHRGKLDEDLLRLICLNSRTPDLLAGDVRAMVAALRIGATRVKDLIEHYGVDAFEAYSEAILDHADRLTRQELQKIPAGTYEAEYFLDGDGDDGKPISQKMKVVMRITVKGEHMTVDMSDSAQQSKGPMNCPGSNTISHVRCGFKSVTTPYLPINDGSFRALDVVLKQGTFLDPLPPAPVGLWVEAAEGLPDLMLRALAPAIPNKVRGATLGTDAADSLWGTDPRSGKFYIASESSAPGGWGAKPYEDGETMCGTGEGDIGYPWLEIYETLYPFLVRRFELIRDSGGPGKYRGGVGIAREITPINNDARATVFFERQVYSPPWGLFGGKNGRGSYVTIVRRDGTVEKHEKVTDYPLNQGDTMVLETGGGGGYGDPLERDTNLVLKDVLDGIVSLDKARDEYGVIVNLSEERVDTEATQAQRLRMKS